MHPKSGLRWHLALVVLVQGMLLVGKIAMAEDQPVRKEIAVELTPGPSTLVDTFPPALKCAGKAWTREQVMGLFGLSFCFSLNDGGGPLQQTSNIDWSTFFSMLKYLDVECEVITASLNGAQKVPPEQMKQLKEDAWKKVKVSIDRGVPAIAWSPMTVSQRDAKQNAFEWALIVGYEEATGSYIVRHRSSPKAFAAPHDQIGFVDPVQWFCVIVIGAPKEDIDVKVRQRAVLEQAVALGKGDKIGSMDAAAGGKKAFALWRKAIRDGSVNWEGVPQHARFLENTRTAAGAFLENLAADFQGADRQGLLDAAKFYRQEAAVATALIAAGEKKDVEQSVKQLDEVAAAEEKAIEQLESVVKHTATSTKNTTK